jgi:hypothetical protein
MFAEDEGISRMMPDATATFTTDTDPEFVVRRPRRSRWSDAAGRVTEASGYDDRVRRVAKYLRIPPTRMLIGKPATK